MRQHFFKLNRLNWFTGALMGLSVPLAFADGLKPYDAAAFAKAQADQKTIVLDYYADWCPTCRVQKTGLEGSLQSTKFENVVAFEVNYDQQPADLKKQLKKVNEQSTLIILKGKSVRGRASGITDQAEIGRLIEKGL